MIHNSSYIDTIFKEYDLIKNFKEVFDQATNDILSLVGNRKKVLDYVFVYKDHRFVIQHNRTIGTNSLIKEIMFQILKRTHKYYHHNIQRGDDFRKLLDRFDCYLYKQGAIHIIFNEENNTWKKDICDELKSFASHAYQIDKHIDEIKPDFSNYAIKEKNIEPDMEMLNNYIDILLKYSDKLQLNRYRKVSMGYYYGGSYGVSSSSISGHPEMIKSELNKLIGMAMKYSSDVIEIIPDNVRKIIDGVDIEFIDLLSFKVVLNDNAVAVNKYLLEERGRAISNYYDSKPSGSYVGD